MAQGAPLIDDAAELAVLGVVIVGALWLWNRSQSNGSAAGAVVQAASDFIATNPTANAIAQTYDAGQSVGQKIDQTSAGQSAESSVADALCWFTGNC